MIIKNILEGKHLPVYGDGSNVRDWLYGKTHYGRRLTSLCAKAKKRGRGLQRRWTQRKDKPEIVKSDYLDHSPLLDDGTSRISPNA
ncbi:hypothetical protein NXV38_21765 [Bacteroides caccae]|nr:hypothetical protein [Bacteroides caccae]